VAKKKQEPSQSAGSVSPALTGLSGVKLVNKVVALLEALPGRLRDDTGEPGGLVMFPDGLRPIIIGDLHANRENLKLILDHDGNRADLEAGRAACIFLGDVLHDDRTGHMKDMTGSVAMLDDLFEVFLAYPGRVYYIRGNHDSFDERLRKSGISQGAELKHQLLASKGKEFVDAVQVFFDALPVFIIGKGYVITHAGPPRGGLVREELINIKRYPEKYHQLLWNRLNEFHGNPSLKEYGEKDLRLVLDFLDLPPDTHFIVGHNPLWNDGNKIGVWMNVIGIKNHHILYSGYGSKAPYFTIEKGELVCKQAMAQQVEAYYYG
jgi:hypothetical protein